MVLGFLEKEFKGKFDYFYLPLDKSTRCNKGYAYINLCHPLFAVPVVSKMNGLAWQSVFKECKSDKVCKLEYANW